jgi:hypothetical protein
MPRSRLSAVLATTSVVLAAHAAVGSAAQPPKSRAAKLTLGIVTRSLNVVDVGPTGASPGDMVIESDGVTRNGKPFGTAEITCFLHSGEILNGRAECFGTFYLPKGQLETQGGARSVNGAISGAGAVTGGTRRYHAARGSYSFNTTTGTRRIIEFRLARGLTAVFSPRR